MHTATPDTDELTLRLHKMEGQIRGVGHMVADGAPAVDILTQLAAVRGAIDAVVCAVAEGEVRRWAPSDAEAAAIGAVIARLARW